MNERERKYKEILSNMTPGQPYTAAELGVAPASLTAMVNREMVTRVVGKPMRYVRPKERKCQVEERILAALEGYPEGSQFALHKNGYATGVVCVIHKGMVCNVNDYMKRVDTTDYTTLFIKGKKVELE